MAGHQSLQPPGKSVRASRCSISCWVSALLVVLGWLVYRNADKWRFARARDKPAAVRRVDLRRAEDVRRPGSPAGGVGEGGDVESVLKGQYPPRFDFWTDNISHADPHRVPRPFYMEASRPAGWGAADCGIGPPPRDPPIPGGCLEAVRAYLQHCAGEGQRSPERTWAVHECSVTSGTVGRPVTLVVVARGPGGAMDCGPLTGLYDTLDTRVDSDTSVEVGVTAAPYPWLQLVAFRPQAAGRYTVSFAHHFRNWPGGWSLPGYPPERLKTLELHHTVTRRLLAAKTHSRSKNLPRMRGRKTTSGIVKSLGGTEYRNPKGGYRARGLWTPQPNLPPDVCPSHHCNAPGSPWGCGLAAAVHVQVAQGNCPERARPPCQERPPRAPGAWFGRWVLQCTGKESCSKHPVPTRSVYDLSKGMSERLTAEVHKLEVEHCAVTARSGLEQNASSAVFGHPGGWVWEPDVCKPRVFSEAEMWRCLNNSSIVTVGDSVASTQTHFLTMHMDALLRPNANLSYQGNRFDEQYGTLTPRLRDAVEGRASFSLSYIMKGLLRDLETVDVKGEKGADSFLFTQGLHDARWGTACPLKGKKHLLKALSGLPSRRVVWAPTTPPHTRHLCTNLNAERTYLSVVSALAALHNLTTEGVADLPEVIYLPTYEAGRAMARELAAVDHLGTHPLCSFVGLSYWMQYLDVTCTRGIGTLSPPT
eukprot:Hpha_TRINITY_DN4195_c0_g1::TRINITY_DN4195_c0_g1_i1::g.194782::m.194782